MKRTIVILFVIGLVLVIGGQINQALTQYTREAEVVAVKGEQVTAIDNCGFYWHFIGEGFEKGEQIVLVLNGGQTTTLLDDEVIDIERG